MKPEQQRIAIAEACGYTDITSQQVPIPRTLNDRREVFYGRRGGYSFELPNYPASLDAMHEAFLSLGGVERYMFNSRLQDMLGQKEAINATAAQRAEAFLKTLSLWQA